MRPYLLALAPIVLLAGCGSGNQDSYDSAKAVAQAAGCTQIKPAPSGETTLYATDEVSCQSTGYTLVDWFKDSASLNNFRDASNSAGITILYGHNWAISCVDNKDDCSAFKAKLGGELG